MGPIRLDRREDGTISSAWQEVTETATLPSGREVTETRWDQIALDDLDALLGASYAQFGAHNAALEDQIAAERDAHAAALAERDAAHAAQITERDVRISALEAEIATLKGQLAA